MKKIIAHRLSEGNKVFPTEIHIEERGLTIRIPGLFSGKSQFFDYKQISSVSVNAPLIGYSTITFYAADTKISAHGFKKEEVNEIKQAIDKGKLHTPIIKMEGSLIMNNQDQILKNVSVADELIKLKQLLDAGVLTQEEFNIQKGGLLNK